MDGAMASRMVFPAAFAHRVELEPRAAALVEPTSVALHAVRRGRVAGQRVLVVGAGPIGLLVAQCARAEGAAAVVITDTREDRLTLAAALGFPCAGEAARPSRYASRLGRRWRPSRPHAPQRRTGPDRRRDPVRRRPGGDRRGVRGRAPRRDGRRARALRRADDPVRLRRAWSCATST